MAIRMTAVTRCDAFCARSLRDRASVASAAPPRYATLVGNLTAIINEGDASLVEFRSKLGRMNAYMATNGLPSRLQRRVRRYYEYLHVTADTGAAGDDVLADLPRYLQVTRD